VTMETGVLRLCHQFGFVGSPGKALFCLSFLESGQKW
jgi:hypothetical protein